MDFAIPAARCGVRGFGCPPNQRNVVGWMRKAGARTLDQTLFQYPPVDTRSAAPQGHYTGHFKSVVTKPQNVCVARDIACGGYVAGGNCKFFSKKDDNTGYSLAAFTKNLQDRLGFANDDGKAYASLMAFPMSKKQYDEGKMDTVMSITSRMLPWDTNGTTNSYFPGGESGYTSFASKLGLDTIHYGEDIRASENMEYISQGSVNNSLCFVGPHRKWSQWASSHVELVPGQGHFGPDAVPGVSPPVLTSRCCPPVLMHCFCCAGRSLASWRGRVAQGGTRSHEDLRVGGSCRDALHVTALKTHFSRRERGV